MDLMSLINKKKQELSANNRAKTAKIPDGTSRWRILPGWRPEVNGEKDETFFHDFGAHYIKDATKTMKAVYVCTEKTFNRPCSVCATIATAMHHAVDDATQALLKEAGATPRVLVNAIQVDGQSQNTPVILEIAPTVFSSILGIMQEWGNILDLNEGKDLVVERTGKGVGTKYTVQVAAKSITVSPEVMKKITNLDDYVAQENEQGRLRAINSTNNLVGLLPSAEPTLVGGSKPNLAAITLDEEAENDLAALMSGGTTTAPAVSAASMASTNVVDAELVEQSAKPSAEDVAKVDATVAVAAAATKPAPATVTDEDDLDALINSL